MKNMRQFFPLPLYILLLVSLVSCTSPSSLEPEPKPAPRVILDVECGWEVLSIPENSEGILKITDSLDNQSETHTFIGIHTPTTVLAPVLFDGKAIILDRFDTTYFNPRNPFVSGEEDYMYIADTLNNLIFSKEISIRHETDSRIVIFTYVQENGSLDKINDYYICADGIVLKSGEKDGAAVYYESLSPVDYYELSALEIKYKSPRIQTNWGFLSAVEPNSYRLCVSDQNGHRDYTLDEAKELLPMLLNIKNTDSTYTVSKINHISPNSLDSCLKVTEYYYIDIPSEVEEHTYYLSSDGKLRTEFRDAFAHMYHNGDWEYFYCNLVWEAEEDFNFNSFRKLLEP